MKKLLAVFLFAPLGTGFAADLPAGPAAIELPTEHTVAPKDTLWDLAGRYYHDHYKWRYIAEANPAPLVKDPHWIYPNQKLRIPVLPESEVSPEKETPVEPERAETPATEETPRPQAPRPVQKPRRPRGPERNGSVGGEGISEDFPPSETGAYPFSGRFKAKPGWRPEGVVLADDRDGEHMVREGDVVQIRLGVEARAKKGDEYSVFRPAAALDTEPDQKALYLMRVGRLEIQGPAGGKGKEGVYSASVVQESDSVQQNDWVKRGD